MRGGQQTSTVKVTLQPRIQKDKWSMYWKESMATKTDSFAAVTVEADVNTTVAKLQQVWQVAGSSLACSTAKSKCAKSQTVALLLLLLLCKTADGCFAELVSCDCSNWQKVSGGNQWTVW